MLSPLRTAFSRRQGAFILAISLLLDPAAVLLLLAATTR